MALPASGGRPLGASRARAWWRPFPRRRGGSTEAGTERSRRWIRAVRRSMNGKWAPEEENLFEQSCSLARVVFPEQNRPYLTGLENLGLWAH